MDVTLGLNPLRTYGGGPVLASLRALDPERQLPPFRRLLGRLLGPDCTHLLNGSDQAVGEASQLGRAQSGT